MSPGSFWFINAAAGAGGDGRLTAPFNSISAFNSTAADDPGDNIFLFSGSYPSTILLLENQRLIGQGATSTLQTITGLIPPTGSLAFPSTGGTRPTIAVGAGTGVTLASGNSVLGLNVTNSAGHGITGSAVGTLTLADFDVTVTGGSALSLTTSDTVTATGADNDLSATTGAALNVANVTIGAAGMTFKSISSSGGTNNGLTLDTTGSSGGLTVTGDGTNTSVGGNGSGGTITNKSGADGNFTNGIGIYLNSTSNVVLRRMTINGTNQNYGIRGNLVNNFTLEYSTVNGTNGTAATRPSPENYGEGSVHFGNSTTTGMTGTGTVTNCVFAGGRARNFSVVNSSGTLNRLTITGCTFGLIQNFSDANSNLACEARKGSNPTLNATVTGCSFQGQPGDAANFTGQGVTTMDVIFGGVTATRGTAPGNAITNSHAQNIIGGGSLTFATKGAMTFHCLGNTMRDAHGSAVTFFKAGKDAGDPDPSLSGFFNNHEIGVAAALDSGSKSGNGIFVSAGGTGTMSYTITNNFIHQIRGNAHIYADNTGGSYTANFTITGNTLDTPGLPTWFAGIAVTNGSPISSDTVNVCAKIGGSTAAEKNTLNLAGNLGVIVGGSGANGGHTFNLPGYAGGASEAAREANVESLLTSNNAGSFTADAYVDAPATFGGTFTGIGAGCGTPASLMLAGSPTTAAATVAENCVCGCGRELAVFKTAVSPVASPSTDVSRETPDAAGGTPVLTQSELDALVASARDRWTASGLTDEQLATLRTLKFEVADLPGWYLGEAGGERIRVDADAGGNGWFIDPTPGKDEEFGVPEGQQKLAGGEARNERNHRNQSENGMHPGRGAGISAAPAGAGSVSFGGPVVLARGLASPPANFRSPSGTGNAQLDNFGDPSETRNAHPAAATRRYTDPAGAPAGHIDLLTALLHEMGHALGLDDTYLEKDRDNLMYGFLTKGERRLPAKDQAVGATPHAEAHPHFLGTPLNIGDLPAGKTVTITYVVNISSATPNVSNQGTVSGSNFANVLTDDPTVAGTANPTVTPVELPPVVSNVAKGANEDVAVAFAASDFTPRQLQRSEWRRAHDGAHYFAPGEWGAEDQREHIYGAAGHRDREHRQPHLHVELELQRWR